MDVLEFNSYDLIFKGFHTSKVINEVTYSNIAVIRAQLRTDVNIYEDWLIRVMPNRVSFITGLAIDYKFNHPIDIPFISSATRHFPNDNESIIGVVIGIETSTNTNTLMNSYIPNFFIYEGKGFNYTSNNMPSWEFTAVCWQHQPQIMQKIMDRY